MAAIISSLTLLLAALSFLYGLNTWRREFIGKRRLELLEGVLSQFYEAQDAINYIRNPFSFGGEGETRKEIPGESDREKKGKTKAYVPYERYLTYEKLFADLRSQKYRMMALFGAEYGAPFDGIKRETNGIIMASIELGRKYWVEDRSYYNEEQNRQFYDIAHKYESTIWHIDGDEIDLKISEHVNKIEELSRKQTIALETSKIDDLAIFLMNKLKR